MSADFGGIDWREVVNVLGGSNFRWMNEEHTEFRFYKFGWGNGFVLVGDNGGEINVAAIDHAPILRESIPYTRWGVICCAWTMAGRLKEAVETGFGSVDWDWGADLDREAAQARCAAVLTS